MEFASGNFSNAMMIDLLMSSGILPLSYLSLIISVTLSILKLSKADTISVTVSSDPVAFCSSWLVSILPQVLMV